MIIRREIDMDKPLSDEQRKMLEALRERPVTADDDCPELTSEQLSSLAKASESCSAVIN